MSDKPLSYGEKAVGLNFNPSGDPGVMLLKQAFAQVIDFCNTERETATNSEEKRLWSVAITEAQGAQMWAVKAATWQND